MSNVTIANYSLLEIFWYIVIFSFIGWVLEVIYRYYHDKKFVNRGFLHGPFCPIYGFGIASIFIATSYLGLVNFSINASNLLKLFIVSIALTTILEYLVGYLLMLLFNHRWWDYSNLKYNLHGFIALRFSIYWGLGGSLLYLLLDKLELNQGINLSHKTFEYLTVVLIVYFTIDFTKSIDVALRLRKFTNELKEAAVELRGKIESFEFDIDHLKLETALRKDRIEDYFEELGTKLSELRSDKRQQLSKAVNRYQSLLSKNRVKQFNHILTAFPNIKHLEDESLLDTIKDRLDLPRVRINITHKERPDVIYDNIGRAEKNADVTAKQLISPREGWPKLSMHIININNDKKYERNDHRLSHLYYVLEGHGELKSDKENYQLNKNSYIYLPKGLNHQISGAHLVLICIIPNESSFD